MDTYFFQSVLEERTWSWAFIGLVTFVIALVIRSVILRDILLSVKLRDRKWYRRTQSHYQKRCLLGWLLFIAFLAETMLFWRFETFFLKYLERMYWILIGLALVAGSFIMHLRAYARAIVDAIEERIASDKDL